MFRLNDTLMTDLVYAETANAIPRVTPSFRVMAERELRMFQKESTTPVMARQTATVASRAEEASVTSRSE